VGTAYRLSEKLDLALRELREAVSLGEASGLAQLHLCITLVAKGRSVIESGKEFDLDRWSEAWGYFEECWSLSQEIHGSRFAPEAELLFATADLLVEMATISNEANPPLMERYSDRELDLLCSAGAPLIRAGRVDPERPEVERRFDELARFVHFIGEDALRKLLETAPEDDRTTAAGPAGQRRRSGRQPDPGSGRRGGHAPRRASTE
jgi:hypothetical protein